MPVVKKVKRDRPSNAVESGNRVRDLREKAKMTQEVLRERTGITTRTIRTWEAGVLVSQTNRKLILAVLAEAHGHDEARLIAEVEALVAKETPNTVRRAPVEIALPKTHPSDWLLTLVTKAIDGFIHESSIYCFPSLLKSDPEGFLFLVERHVLSPGLSELRAEHAVIQVPVHIEEGKALFRSPRPSKLEDPMERLGTLPFVGTPTLRAIRLDLAAPAVATVGALITPLCRERTVPAVPRLLSTMLESGEAGTEPSPEHLANWIELASSLTTAVWSLHARGWAHFGVSPDNVLVREDHGRWRDVTLLNIDLREGGDLRKQSSRRRWKMQQEDLLGLRDMLMSALIGSAVDPGRDPVEVEALRERVHGELGRRAMNLCLRHLMVLEPDATHIEASTERLRKLLHDLGALEALVRRTAARGTLMRGTLPGAPPRNQRKDGVISALLVAIRESADGADRQAWCAAYVRDDGAQPVDVDGCARLLAAGHGRSALRALTQLVRDPRATLSPRDLIRALRMLAGVLLAREGATDEAVAVVDLFADHADAGVAWWVKLLREKATFARDPQQIEAIAIPAYPGVDPVEKRRADGWHIAQLTLRALAHRQAPTADQLRELERLLHGDASHEAASGALILARALAFDHSMAGFRRAMSALQLAASYSAARGLPHEQAAALAITAAVVRRAFANPRLCASLLEHGVNADESLVLAADCALLAAEMYQWLDAPARSRKGYRAAAACFFACPRAPEHVVEGFRWIGLSRNHRLLPWSPPDLAPGAVLRARPRDRSAQREEDEERRALDSGVAGWRDMSKGVPGASGYRDPGSVFADNYSDLYGPGIEHVYRTGATTVELLRARSDGGLEPAPGGVVLDLLSCAERWFGRRFEPGARVLQLRCGTGTEASILARDRGLSVVGVDSSVWSIRRAEKLGEGISNLRFERAELLDLGAMRAREGAFDVVLLHDSLGQMVCKRELLEGAAGCLKEGGVLLGTEWVQSRTATRRYWQRLFETLWVPDLETRDGCRRLLDDAGFSTITIEPRDAEMAAFFDNCLTWLRATLSSGEARSPEEITVLQRARTDIGALRKLCSDAGPLGWVRFGAVASRDPDRVNLLRPEAR
jgi:SAM-dependent methyltransferase/transcriptional regulator with XRE-family HTH domain